MLKASSRNYFNDSSRPLLAWSIVTMMIGLLVLDVDKHVGISAMAIGSFMILARGGYEYKPKSPSIRYYANWFGIRAGRWIQLNRSSTLVLRSCRTYQLLGGFTFPMHESRGRTYDLFTKVDGEEKLLLEFSDYGHAILLLRIIHSQFDIPIVNEVANTRRKYSGNRR